MSRGFAVFEDIVRRERWGNRYVWVARDPKTKKILTWKNVKGSKTNKEALIERYKENNTFTQGKKRQSTTLTNFKEVVDLYDTKKQAARSEPRGQSKRQYVVQGKINGVEVVARSQVFGSAFAGSRSQMIERARESFWERINQQLTGGYDADEGLKFEDQVTDYKEGWVYYAAV